MSRELRLVAEHQAEASVTVGVRMIRSKTYVVVRAVLTEPPPPPRNWPERLELKRVISTDSAGEVLDALILFDPSDPARPLLVTDYQGGHEAVTERLAHSSMLVEIYWPFAVERALVDHSEVTEVSETLPLSPEEYLWVASHKGIEVLPGVTGHGGEA